MKWLEDVPVAIITFDDGVNEHFQVAYPILKKRGIRGTCYIVTSRTAFYPDMIMSFEDIKKLHADGWAMECHTHTHRNLTTLTNEEIYTEMDNVDAGYVEMGLPLPKHHAYPQGGFTEDAKQIVSEYRTTQRKVGWLPEHFNDTDTLDMSALMGINADVDTDELLNTLKACIDNTVSAKGIFIPYTHGFNVAVTKNFKIMIDHAIAQGMSFITINELPDYLERRKNGFHKFIR